MSPCRILPNASCGPFSHLAAKQAHHLLCGYAVHLLVPGLLGCRCLPDALDVQADEGEAENMVLVPCWAEADAADSCIAVIVDAVLDVLGPLASNADLRLHTANLNHRIQRILQAIATKEVQALQA